MQGINKTFSGGNLGSGPEIRYLQDGTAVCSFSLAMNKKYKDKNGEKKEVTTWAKVNVWGKQAESCAEYLKKGSAVLVEGSLVENRWEDKDTGKQRSKLEIKAYSVTFLGGEGERSSEREEPPQGDDDIPF